MANGQPELPFALDEVDPKAAVRCNAGMSSLPFQPDDPSFNRANALFLAHAAALVRSGGGIIDHIDCTIICEEPKVGPHRSSMRTRIAEILGLDEAQVSMKATTTEGLGFTGRREGIAAQALASIRMGLPR